ncbi:FUSC family protein [Acuticoccus mangrovi]|uniref:FUSC family protein n=1 Tax=Acuticoccus mangrovi TaxID=2796142 RepID=A0A934IUM6_9HYPH|nr:FUSC family protein [Acuticoccus mangrovi]MBJ3778462.1 FUSC family protein [Acuticoccus mangrovi]
MTPVAEATWPAVYAQTVRDLAPFPGRFDLTWRMAALCALVAATAMLYEIPESAISCYLVIFLMRPDASETIGQAVGLMVLVTVIVATMVPLANATVDLPFARLLIMAGATFATLYLASASTLGESGAIIGLVIAFVLSLIGGVPDGFIATKGLSYAWQMVMMPMGLMVAFLLVCGRGPQRLVAETIARRLAAAERALTDADDDEELLERLHEGNDDLLKRVKMARLLHLVPTARTGWLAGASETSYRLLVAVAAMPRGAAAARRRLAAACGAARRRIETGDAPLAPERAEAPGSLAEVEAWRLLTGLAAPNGGADPSPAKAPFLTADAFTSPVHQRYALKTTAAAMICYLIYTGISWQGIHTAMITCYVTALGTTGETVHKLALRIVGCLVGAAMGVASILFVIPHVESVGALMVLVFVGILVAGWVAAGNERVSYAGVQVGLAFLLTILDGFGPSTSMENAWDRIAGILLGNTIMYLIFTGIWPRSAAEEVRRQLAAALRALARLAATAPSDRPVATAEVASAAVALGRAREVMFMLPFEPRRDQPARAEVERLAGLVTAASALTPAVAVSAESLKPVAAALEANAATLEASEPGEAATHPAAGAVPPIPSAEIAGPMARIETLVVT